MIKQTCVGELRQTTLLYFDIQIHNQIKVWKVCESKEIVLQFLNTKG